MSRLILTAESEGESANPKTLIALFAKIILYSAPFPINEPLEMEFGERVYSVRLKFEE